MLPPDGSFRRVQEVALMEPETPEEFEERMDKIADLFGIAREMELSILSNLDAIKKGIHTHFDLMKNLTDLVGG